MPTKALLWLALLLTLIVGFVYWYTLNPVAPAPGGATQTPPGQGEQPAQGARIANPASVNCVTSLHGTLEIVNDEAAGGAVGYCHLPDGRVCEEWALMRDNSCVSPAQ